MSLSICRHFCPLVALPNILPVIMFCSSESCRRTCPIHLSPRCSSLFLQHFIILYLVTPADFVHSFSEPHFKCWRSFSISLCHCRCLSTIRAMFQIVHFLFYSTQYRLFIRFCRCCWRCLVAAAGRWVNQLEWNQFGHLSMSKRRVSIIEGWDTWTGTQRDALGLWSRSVYWCLADVRATVTEISSALWLGKDFHVFYLFDIDRLPNACQRYAAIWSICVSRGSAFT